MVVEEQERIQIRQRRLRQLRNVTKSSIGVSKAGCKRMSQRTTASPFRSLQVDEESPGFFRDSFIAPPAHAEPQQKSAVRMVEGKKRTIFAVLNL